MIALKLGRTACAFALSAGFVLNSAAAVFAQGATTPAPAPLAAPESKPMPALSASHLALATEVVKVSGLWRSVDKMVPTMVQRTKEGIGRMRPEIGKQVDEALKSLKPQFDEQEAEALKIAATALAQHMSEQELGEVKNFFMSPVGKKFVDEQPTIVADMFRGLDDFSNRFSDLIIRLMRDELKKKNIEL